jgi:VIT1/CCC1 family predicted Fe2+/Mn2+ transporter
VTPLAKETPVNGTTPTGRPLLDPIDRISEIIFGLIMAVTIVGSLSVASAGREDVRTALFAALGCNLAWGLVDAVMYLVQTLTERTRNLALAKRLVGLAPSDARRVIAEDLPPHVAALAGPEELDGMHRRLNDLSLPLRPRLERDDYVGAIGIFLLVVIATFPVVVPFIVVSDVVLAMNLSRALTLAMLFFAGLMLGRYASHARPIRTGLAMAILGALLIGAVKALGG